MNNSSATRLGSLKKIKNNPVGWSRRGLLLIILLGYGWSGSFFAQTLDELTARRHQLIAEIDKASRQLAATQKGKSAALERFNVLQKQVAQRQELIETLEQEMSLSAQAIHEREMAIKNLQVDLLRLEKEYAQLARKAYRNQMTQDEWVFLLKADGLADALKRWRYLQQYDAYRKRQIKLILSNRNKLDGEVKVLNEKRIVQEELLSETREQEKKLAQELKQRLKLLNGLEADERRFARLLRKKREAHRKLSAAVEKMIAAASHFDKENNSSKENITGNTPTIALTDGDEAAATAFFEKEKGKLPWPLAGGYVSRHFGEQSHPVHKQVMITNNGIDIRSSVESRVVAIAGGVVVGTQFVPGFQYTLIIRHGNYYSVYSNLERVQVKKGGRVEKEQLLGKAADNQEGNQGKEVHLEIWKGKKRLNPVLWLRGQG